MDCAYCYEPIENHTPSMLTSCVTHLTKHVNEAGLFAPMIEEPKALGTVVNAGNATFVLVDPARSYWWDIESGEITPWRDLPIRSGGQDLEVQKPGEDFRREIARQKHTMTLLNDAIRELKRQQPEMITRQHKEPKKGSIVITCRGNAAQRNGNGSWDESGWKDQQMDFHALFWDEEPITLIRRGKARFTKQGKLTR